MIRIVCSVVLSLLLAGAANADLVISFSTDNGSTFIDATTITAGDTISVGIYLRDSDPNGVLVNDGLFGFGMVGELAPQNLGTIRGTMINPAFEFEPMNASTSVRIDWKAATFETAPSGAEIWLGSFDYQSSAAGISSFTFVDRQPGNGDAETDWLSGTGATLDELIFGEGASGSYQFSVNATSAVPEPSSLVLLGCSGIWSVGRRRRAIRSRPTR